MLNHEDRTVIRVHEELKAEVYTSLSAIRFLVDDIEEKLSPEEYGLFEERVETAKCAVDMLADLFEAMEGPLIDQA